MSITVSTITPTHNVTGEVTYNRERTSRKIRKAVDRLAKLPLRVIKRDSFVSPTISEKGIRIGMRNPTGASEKSSPIKFVVSINPNDFLRIIEMYQRTKK